MLRYVFSVLAYNIFKDSHNLIHFPPPKCEFILLDYSPIDPLGPCRAIGCKKEDGSGPKLNVTPVASLTIEVGS